MAKLREKEMANKRRVCEAPSVKKDERTTRTTRCSDREREGERGAHAAHDRQGGGGGAAIVVKVVFTFHSRRDLAAL